MYKKILVPVDGSAGSTAAMKRCIEIAAAETVEKIVLMHVAHFPSQLKSYSGKLGDIGDTIMEELEAKGKKILDESMGFIREKILKVPIETRLVWGDPPYAIVKEVTEDGGYDLVVMGSRGTGGIIGLLMGSTSQYVTNHVSCSVYVVRETT
jgi:nucleotide-binding universal stress UspA family protein